MHEKGKGSVPPSVGNSSSVHGRSQRVQGAESPSTTKGALPEYAPTSDGTDFTDLLTEDDPAPPFDSTEDLRPSNTDTAGRIEISLNLTKKLPAIPDTASLSEGSSELWEPGLDLHNSNCPPLNIAIFIVGSRGDVQPYVALALGLIKSAGHRVRLATHGEFKDFVLDANKHLQGYRSPTGESLEGKLEFFDAGGDPRELMAYMVKNPGLMPGIGTIFSGDIASKKKMTSQYMQGFYKSTFFPDRLNGPFAADAVISNPPAFAHIHVAQALGIPLHMSFTMPWSPTTAFQHPLVTVKESNAEAAVTNYISFSMADLLMWQGLGTLINKFRTSALGLNRLTTKEGPYILNRLNIPWTYCWSQALIPKPKDWKTRIDIAGFYFLEGSVGYTPDEELAAFLKAGPPPMYIGFGSVPVKDPEAMTRAIFEGVQKAGVRALVSAGWGGLGDLEPPSEVFILKGNIPHDWLFAEGRVAAVCHHGGAGTTAIGLKNGLPTIIVPFFGDQQFWGDMVAHGEAGPLPIPPKQLTAERLAEAIGYAYSEKAIQAAGIMGETIRAENGVESGVASFHRNLPLLNMRCDVDPSRVAVWWSHKLCLRLSGAVASLLDQQGLIDIKDLEMLRSKEYEVMKHHGDPLSGTWQGMAHILTTAVEGTAKLFYNPLYGVMELTWGVYAAAWDVVYDMYEGFDNIPGMIGSDVRAKGKVTDWKSGFREGFYGMGYGVWDGITGLVTEPIAAVKQDGAKGLMTGVGRSAANFVSRPVAGSLGLFMLPARGIAQSVISTFRRTPEMVFRGPRTDLSRLEAARLTKEEKDRLVSTFHNLKLQTRSRRKTERKRRHRVFLTGEMMKGATGDVMPRYEESPTGSRTQSRTNDYPPRFSTAGPSRQPSTEVWSQSSSVARSALSSPATAATSASNYNALSESPLETSSRPDLYTNSSLASSSTRSMSAKQIARQEEKQREEADKQAARLAKQAQKDQQEAEEKALALAEKEARNELAEKRINGARAILDAKLSIAERKQQKEDDKHLVKTQAREAVVANRVVKAKGDPAKFEKMDSKDRKKWEEKVAKREAERAKRIEEAERLRAEFVKDEAKRQLKEKEKEKKR